MPVPKPILKDPLLQEQFERDGFVKFRLLSEEQAERLHQFYKENKVGHDVTENLYHSTTDSENPELIDKVDKFITSQLAAEVEKHFQNYELMISSFLIKTPGEGSETRIHQDPTFIDESRYLSANIWVAVHDINHKNGNLYFVKGSHHIVSALRVTPNCPVFYDDFRDIISNYITEVPVKKGEAIVINHALIHGATANLSGSDRVAAAMAIRSAGAVWMLYYQEAGNSKIGKYKIDRDVFMKMAKSGKPAQEAFQEYITYDFPKVSRADFIAFMEKQKPKRTFFRSLMSSLKG